jgi:hypothetical protein
VVCQSIWTEEAGHLLLHGKRKGFVCVTKKEHAVNIVPRLVGDGIGEDGGRLMLDLGESLLLQLGLHVVIEDYLRRVGVNVVTLHGRVSLLVVFSGGWFLNLTSNLIHGRNWPPSISLILLPSGVTKAARYT